MIAFPATSVLYCEDGAKEDSSVPVVGVVCKAAGFEEAAGLWGSAHALSEGCVPVVHACWRTFV